MIFSSTTSSLIFIMLHLIKVYYIISYHVTSYYIIYIISYPIIPYCIISHHIVSYHIMPYHIISYHIIPYHTILYHIIICLPYMCLYSPHVLCPSDFEEVLTRREFELACAPILEVVESAVSRTLQQWKQLKSRTKRLVRGNRLFLSFLMSQTRSCQESA